MAKLDFIKINEYLNTNPMKASTLSKIPCCGYFIQTIMCLVLNFHINKKAMQFRKQIKILSKMSLFLFFNSCAILDKYSFDAAVIDLSIFEKEGMFVTTGDISRNYKSASIVIVDCYQGYVPKEDVKIKKSKSSNSGYDDLYGSKSTSFDKIKDFNFKGCEINDLFEEIIYQAKGSDANSIIKLEIRNISKSSVDGRSSVPGIQVIGLAINIED
ncbi:hypothetical protein [Belliella pelovolcani]|nr:hypothetical protein [Belliella pelovolcani]